MSDSIKHDPWFLRLPTLAEEEEGAEHSPSKENMSCDFGELPYARSCPYIDYDEPRVTAPVPNYSTPFCAWLFHTGIGPISDDD